MDSVKSFKGYGKVDPVEDETFRRKTRKRLIIVGVSVFILVVIIIAVVAGTVVRKTGDADDDVPATPMAAVKSICSVTRYPESCTTSLESSNSSDPKRIFQFSLNVLMDSLQKLSTVPDRYINRSTDPIVNQALNVCKTVLNDAIDSLNDSISIINDSGKMEIHDLSTWLSTVITDEETCFDSLDEVNATFANEIKELAKNSTEYASNSLAIVSRLMGLLGDFKITLHRRLLAESEFPNWVDRRLLQEEIMPPANVTVASDGSGDVRTIGEAVKRIPKKSKTMFVIYVKSGRYVENVVMDKSCWNVMIYGDGKGVTIVSGSKNFVDGTPTFETATFA